MAPIKRKRTYDEYRAVAMLLDNGTKYLPMVHCFARVSRMDGSGTQWSYYDPDTMELLATSYSGVEDRINVYWSDEHG